MAGISRSRGVGVYVASEAHNFMWDRLAKPGGRVVVSCQGSHSTADSILTAGWERANALSAAGYVLVQGDLAQTTTQGTFGNATSETRVGQLRTFALGSSAPVPAAGKVHLIGGSGGVAAALNYARANPGNVASIYGMVPLVDIEDVYNNRTDVDITQAEIDAAYTDHAGFLAAMPARNPSRAGNQAALAGIPIRLAYSTNDPYITVASVLGYVAAVNAAGGNATAFSMGAVGHDTPGLDPYDCARFFKEHP